MGLCLGRAELSLFATSHSWDLAFHPRFSENGRCHPGALRVTMSHAGFEGNSKFADLLAHPLWDLQLVVYKVKSPETRSYPSQSLRWKLWPPSSVLRALLLNTRIFMALHNSFRRRAQFPRKAATAPTMNSRTPGPLVALGGSPLPSAKWCFQRPLTII